MRNALPYAFGFLLLVCALLPGAGRTAEIDRFAGNYAGSAIFEFEDAWHTRELSTSIRATKKGFTVTWTSLTYRGDGRSKQKSYTVDFVPSTRDHIYKSAMATNRFGKPTPLDPLQGEPFVWARIERDTFTVYSLSINEIGEYELQEYHRTLVKDGLNLLFRRVHNGVPEKEIRALLRRQD
ncbi:hypothetical protein [uncultured Sulfitobacter sp.]|uniref:hypothetical protein n=1 Tax=uncultured Sulfitobacter sp. TaxID=191468 RepID=UPI00261F31F8|nr:hypothetical protein [uncultured Sulfitobacter sp.]